LDVVTQVFSEDQKADAGQRQRILILHSQPQTLHTELTSEERQEKHLKEDGCKTRAGSLRT